jgi:chemotaxis protein CheZ
MGIRINMKKNLKSKIINIVDGKLSETEIEELIDFFKYALLESFDQEDEHFFKDLAYEMSASVKDLAFILIDFRRDLRSRIHPDITDLTEKYIPQAADQLEGIIETTKKAANNIMDNLEAMQINTETVASILRSLRAGKVRISDGEAATEEMEIDRQAIEAITPPIEQMESIVENNLAIITNAFVQMSFQDLTGQRIKRIMKLVGQMESRLQKMVVSFGIKITEKEKNPGISDTELQQAVSDKETELAGPQKAGCGLDQAGIDNLLANI